MLVIVACMKPECIGVRAQSQDCRTRLRIVAGTWLRIVADMVDVICVDVLMECLGKIVGTGSDHG